jgi:hypothetical protein
LIHDKAYALKACKQRGNTLKVLHGELKADEDIVLEAVQQDGLALRFASPVVRREREIVLAACKQNGWSASLCVTFFFLTFFSCLSI